MNWSNVKLILCREVRDQLRDRRTLFMIAVLPLLLYPLLGMSMFQMVQFVREQATKVLVIGQEHLPKTPALIEDGQFAARYFSDEQKTRLLELHFEPETKSADEGRLAVERGDYQAVIYVPADFASRLDDFREMLRRHNGGEEPKIPSPEIFYNRAKEKSQLAYIRVTQALDKWEQEIGRENLATTQVPPSAVNPFDFTEHDIADEGERQAVVWSKILPFLLLIWALTGAFYPAVDLCAGEKERGTLETLLSSPAERSEIVWGKLLTVMIFSVATAVLNILSIGITGTAVMSQLPELGAPPPLAPLWLCIALVPVSALFSALCLALAAFAKSSKEGQYYLMPLVLLTFPLVILPMAPGVELTLGNSLIPITGVMLLLRAMLEGNYWEALPFMLPVIGVTLVCCWFAMRWAVDQFNSESVLFRESERLDVGLWLKHLMRDREDTPSVAAALFCGVLILMVRFFMGSAMPQPKSFHDLVLMGAVTQLAVIGTPALLMTIMLTRSPTKTLLLRRPPWASLPAAVLLALLAHPAVTKLNMLVQQLYPVSEQMQQVLTNLLADAPGTWQLLLVLAFMPAIFEELAFRGFILSGFRHVGHKWQAIALSSIFFGLAHGILQQSIVACVLGCLIGYLAVQTGSLLPGMFYHLVHNSLAILATRIDLADYPMLSRIVTHSTTDGLVFSWPATIVASVLAMFVLAWFRSLPYPKSSEEVLQEAIEHQAAHAPATL